MNVKKLLSLLLATVLVIGLFGACGKDKDTSTADGATASGDSADQSAEGSSEKTDASDFSVALLLNGTLGDRSFFDSANNGMKMAEEQLGVKTTVVEIGYDATKWEPALLDLCSGDYDVVICGTWQIQEVLSHVAPDYPDQKFIIFDTTMDYSNGDFENVYSIEYKQNDGSFLAGVLAAAMSESGNLGFVGGMDNTVIYDFLVGYIQGAKEQNPDIKVASSFVGDFSNTGRAKELALSQYQMGADVIFSCASTAGDGTMQAGKELGKMLIGVDSDQAELYKENDPELADLILSSVLKRVDISLVQALEKAVKGELEYGQRVAVGIAEDCIDLADNDIYQSQVPENIRNTVNDYKEKIKNGEIKVVTAFGMENDELLDYVNSAK